MACQSRRKFIYKKDGLLPDAGAFGQASVQARVPSPHVDISTPTQPNDALYRIATPRCRIVQWVRAGCETKVTDSPRARLRGRTTALTQRTETRELQ